MTMGDLYGGLPANQRLKVIHNLTLEDVARARAPSSHITLCVLFLL